MFDDPFDYVYAAIGALVIALAVFALSRRGSRYLAGSLASQLGIGTPADELSRIGRRIVAPTLVGLLVFFAPFEQLSALDESTLGPEWQQWAPGDGSITQLNLPWLAFFVAATITSCALSGRGRHTAVGEVTATVRLRDYLPLWPVAVAAGSVVAGLASAAAAAASDWAVGASTVETVVSPASVCAAIGVAALAVLIFGRRAISRSSNRDLPPLWADVIRTETFLLLTATTVAAGLSATAFGARRTADMLPMDGPGSGARLALYTVGTLLSISPALCLSAFIWTGRGLLPKRMLRRLHPVPPTLDYSPYLGPTPPILNER